MTAYKNIPLSVRESEHLQKLRCQIMGWPSIRLMQRYILSVKETEDPGLTESERLVLLAEYYLFRKELLRRMSPLLGRRGLSFISKDNKFLLNDLDGMLKKQISLHDPKLKNIVMEICRRMA